MSSFIFDPRFELPISNIGIIFGIFKQLISTGSSDSTNYTVYLFHVRGVTVQNFFNIFM